MDTPTSTCIHPHTIRFVCTRHQKSWCSLSTAERPADHPGRRIPKRGRALNWEPDTPEPALSLRHSDKAIRNIDESVSRCNGQYLRIASCQTTVYPTWTLQCEWHATVSRTRAEGCG